MVIDHRDDDVRLVGIGVGLGERGVLEQDQGAEEACHGRRDACGGPHGGFCQVALVEFTALYSTGAWGGWARLCTCQ